jgi:sugar phosphate isomerase/epimerase
MKHTAHSSLRGATRRGFLGSAAGAGALLAAGRRKFSKPLGAQLYTVREVMPKQPRETLQAIAAMGFQELEVGRADLSRHAALFQEFKLKPVSSHFETALVTGDWKEWGQNRPPQEYTWTSALEEAKKSGLGYVTVPYIRPKERGGLDYYRSFADKMNAAGEKARAAGLKLCYHNHAFEFATIDGARPFDLLMERFDKSNVGIEMDVFWISVAGEDPAAMLRKYKNRIPLVHLKDKLRGAPVRFAEDVPFETFREVGNGSLDFPGILAAAAESGVEHYFVEQDRCPGDPLASMRMSAEYLKKVRF